jgi:hypothetical protein
MTKKFQIERKTSKIVSPTGRYKQNGGVEKIA